MRFSSISLLPHAFVATLLAAIAPGCAPPLPEAHATSPAPDILPLHALRL
jgi:hypothetical protein